MFLLAKGNFLNDPFHVSLLFSGCAGLVSLLFILRISSFSLSLCSSLQSCLPSLLSTFFLCHLLCCLCSLASPLLPLFPLLLCQTIFSKRVCTCCLDEFTLNFAGNDSHSSCGSHVLRCSLAFNSRLLSLKSLQSLHTQRIVQKVNKISGYRLQCFHVRSPSLSLLV